MCEISWSFPCQDFVSIRMLFCGMCGGFCVSMESFVVYWLQLWMIFSVNFVSFKRGGGIFELGVHSEATGWTVRGSNPGEGEIFRTCPERS